MRILVYGIGVIGACIVDELDIKGNEVTLLQRGRWYDIIKRKGLVIKGKFGLLKKVKRLPVINELNADDIYDVIIVTLRASQVEDIIDILLRNRSKTIVFVGNDLESKELTYKLSEKDVFFAFYSACGTKKTDHIEIVDLKKVIIGPSDGTDSVKDKALSIFNGTKVKVTYEPMMANYLICHAAFIVPMAYSAYHVNGDLKKMKNDESFTDRVVSAYIEGLRAIENAGIKIVPESDSNYEDESFKINTKKFIKLMYSTVLGKIAISDHAMSAPDEMVSLYEGLEKIYRQTDVDISNYISLKDEIKNIDHVRVIGRELRS